MDEIDEQDRTPDGAPAPRHRAGAPLGSDIGALTDRTDDAGVEVVRSEERLRVGTVREPVERVRVVRDVVVEQVTRTVEVRREVLRIEREPLAPGAAPTGAPAPQVIEVVLREERPVVGVEVVPVERVRVEVVPVEQVVRVEEDVRKEQVDLEAPDRAVR